MTVAVNVVVVVDVSVNVGRGVRVGEAVQVGGGMRVGVRVHVGIGVRVTVGVAESASRNACLSAVLVAAVARIRLSVVGLEAGRVVATATVELVVGAARVCELVTVDAAV